MTRFVHGRVHQFNPLVPSRTSQVASDQDIRVLHSDEPVSMETHPQEPTCSIQLAFSIAQHLSWAFYLLWRPCAHYQGWETVQWWCAALNRVCTHFFCVWMKSQVQVSCWYARVSSFMFPLWAHRRQRVEKQRITPFMLHCWRASRRGCEWKERVKGIFRIPEEYQLMTNTFFFSKIIKLATFLFDPAVNYSKWLLNIFSLTWLNYFASSLGSC